MKTAARLLCLTLTFQMIALPMAERASADARVDSIITLLQSAGAAGKLQTAFDRDGMQVLDATGNASSVQKIIDRHASIFAVLTADKRAALRVKLEFGSADRQVIKFTLVDRGRDPQLTLRVQGAVLAASAVSLAAGDDAATANLKMERAIRTLQTQAAGALASHAASDRTFLSKLSSLVIADAHAIDVAVVVRRVVGAGMLIGSLAVVLCGAMMANGAIGGAGGIVPNAFGWSVTANVARHIVEALIVTFVMALGGTIMYFGAKMALTDEEL